MSTSQYRANSLFWGGFLVTASQKLDFHVVCVCALEPHSGIVHGELCIPNFASGVVVEETHNLLFLLPLLATKFVEDTKNVFLSIKILQL